MITVKQIIELLFFCFFSLCSIAVVGSNYCTEKDKEYDPSERNRCGGSVTSYT